MSSLPRPYLTPEEYLELERRAEQKSEYFAGEMFAMSGGTEDHSTIGLNVHGELYLQLKGKPCRPHGANLRILVDPTGLYTYPDASIVCGESIYHDTRKDTIINPTVIIEVLSPSTEAYDRGGKWNHYRKIPSLREYLLISPTEPLIEKFTRKEGSEDWNFTAHEGLDAVVELGSVGCRLALVDVYDRIVFAPAADGPPGGDSR